jgi:O-acetylhomoserine (thiol)-lyase
MNAFLHLQGLETLSLRADRHVANTEALAEWFVRQPGVASVVFPGLEDHPDHERAQRDWPRGAGGVLTFELDGGLEAGKRFLNALQLASRLVNLGDAKTSVTHPASTTHAQLDAAQRHAAGVAPGLIRVATGLEHLDDLVADFEVALAAARAA